LTKSEIEESLINKNISLLIDKLIELISIHSSLSLYQFVEFDGSKHPYFSVQVCVFCITLRSFFLEINEIVKKFKNDKIYILKNFSITILTSYLDQYFYHKCLKIELLVCLLKYEWKHANKLISLYISKARIFLGVPSILVLSTYIIIFIFTFWFMSQ
jgi:hypothetical protein